MAIHLERRTDGHAKGATHRAWPLCWTCLTPIPSEARFRRRWPPFRRECIRPLDAFGFCADHRPDVPFFLGVKREEDRYDCCRVDGKERLRVEWRRSGPYRRTSQAARFRKDFISRGARCVCGTAAAQLGHLIPRYWTSLAGYAADAADFEENFVPLCVSCNGAWYNPYPLAISNELYWHQHRDAHAILQERLSYAFAVAHRRKLRVHQPPPIDFTSVPGQPVLMMPTSPTARYLELVGFVDLYWWSRFYWKRHCGIRGAGFRGSLRGRVAPYLTVSSRNAKA